LIRPDQDVPDRPFFCRKNKALVAAWDGFVVREDDVGVLDDHQAVHPPSTMSVCPVTSAAAGLAR
jgi:hypothetical protein